MADTIRFFEGCSKYVSSLDNSARLRYKEKLFCKEQLPDPYSLISGWLEDMNDWPDVTFGNIYTYLIESPGLFDRQAMQAYKSLEAYNYFISGHVKAVFMHTIAKDCPFCFLKADVVPSQRIRGEPHKPWICVNRSNGSIRSAHCTCMAGLGEVCSHIAAVLFKIEAAVKFGLTTASCTSKACEWNRTYRDQINPVPIADVTYLTKGRRRLNVKSVRCNPDTPLPNDSVLQGLYKVVPTAVFFTAINNIDAEDTDTASESENESVLPKTLASIFKPEVNHLSDTARLVKFNDIWSNYTVTAFQSKELECRTRAQASCPLWNEHRKGRITASKMHDVWRCTAKSPTNLVNSILQYNIPDILQVESVRWGLENEHNARMAYEGECKIKHVEFSCRLSGFTICNKKPFIGASADGIASCKCHGRRTVEIKCPFKHKDSLPTEAAFLDPMFCLDIDGKLKKTHRYYTQIQIQMLVNEVNFGDFVVFTNKGIKIVESIPFDSELTTKLVEASEKFFLANVLPQLVCGKNIKKKKNTLYCLCEEEEYGKMIACDNKDCKIEWFHYPCVDIRRKPRGKWFCPNCST